MEPPPRGRALAGQRAGCSSHLTGETDSQSSSGSQCQRGGSSPAPAVGSPAPREPALTGIARERWSAGGCRLLAPPPPAAPGTGSRRGPSPATSCGPLPPGWTPGLPAKSAPTWQLEPAGGREAGPGAAPRLRSSGRCRGCGCTGLPGVRSRGGPGWRTARAEAEGQGGAAETGGGWSGGARGRSHLAATPACPVLRGKIKCSPLSAVGETEASRGHTLNPSSPVDQSSWVLAPSCPKVRRGFLDPIPG